MQPAAVVMDERPGERLVSLIRGGVLPSSLEVVAGARFPDTVPMHEIPPGLRELQPHSARNEQTIAPNLAELQAKMCDTSLT
jgi:hypothetical protein